jgi:uncharacterized protein YecE (DUF72 family)
MGNDDVIRRRRVLVGTSGYVYRHWRGRFYPLDLPARGWLGFYAAHFPTVELNSPFYRLPAAETFAAWRAAVPPDFVFAVKASRFLTHIRRLRDADEPVQRLLERARHLGPALGPVLFQLPGRFHADLDRLDGLLRALEAQRIVPGLRAVLEVRHPSWLGAPVLQRLRDAGVALCLGDWRELPVRDLLTAPFVYVRRHGAGRRYGGRYPDAALAEDAADIRRWVRGGRDVYVYFNNDERAHAVAGARRLAALAGRRSAGRHGRSATQASRRATSAAASSR